MGRGLGRGLGSELRFTALGLSGKVRTQNICGTQARYLFAGSSELKEFSWLSSAASCVSARRAKFTLFTP